MSLYVGASSAGGGASGRGEERTDSAKAKIKAATHMGLSLITAAIVHWNTVHLDRPVRQLRAQGTTVPDDLRAHVAPARLGAYRPDRRLCLDRPRSRRSVPAATRGSRYVPAPRGSREYRTHGRAGRIPRRPDRYF